MEIIPSMIMRCLVKGTLNVKQDFPSSLEEAASPLQSKTFSRTQKEVLCLRLKCKLTKDG